ncbi:hypothetical protein V2J09_023603 [Rumex salicifolius]
MFLDSDALPLESSTLHEDPGPRLVQSANWHAYLTLSLKSGPTRLACGAKTHHLRDMHKASARTEIQLVLKGPVVVENTPVSFKVSWVNALGVFVYKREEVEFRWSGASWCAFALEDSIDEPLIEQTSVVGVCIRVRIGWPTDFSYNDGHGAKPVLDKGGDEGVIVGLKDVRVGRQAIEERSRWCIKERVVEREVRVGVEAKERTSAFRGTVALICGVKPALCLESLMISFKELHLVESIVFHELNHDVRGKRTVTNENPTRKHRSLIFFLSLILGDVEVPQFINISVLVGGNHPEPVPHIMLLQKLLSEVTVILFFSRETETESPRAPALPATLIRSWRNFSREAMSMILSSTGFEQSMVKLAPFFFPFAAAEAAAPLLIFDFSAEPKRKPKPRSEMEHREAEIERGEKKNNVHTIGKRKLIPPEKRREERKLGLC